MNIKTVVIKAHVRYWEDAEINGVEQTKIGSNIPCKQDDFWCPHIDVTTGLIKNWEIGKTAFIHFKVVDGCGWELLDAEGNVVRSQEDGYVPDCLCPAERGYGDYIIMNIDENGQIAKWKFDLDDFQDEGE